MNGWMLGVCLVGGFLAGVATTVVAVGVWLRDML